MMTVFFCAFENVYIPVRIALKGVCARIYRKQEMSNDLKNVSIRFTLSTL